jgi:hypothetical protein
VATKLPQNTLSSGPNVHNISRGRFPPPPPHSFHKRTLLKFIIIRVNEDIFAASAVIWSALCKIAFDGVEFELYQSFLRASHVDHLADQRARVTNPFYSNPGERDSFSIPKPPPFGGE